MSYSRNLNTTLKMQVQSSNKASGLQIVQVLSLALSTTGIAFGFQAEVSFPEFPTVLNNEVVY